MYTILVYIYMSYICQTTTIYTQIVTYVTLSKVTQTNLGDVLVTSTLIHGDSRSDSIMVQRRKSVGLGLPIFGNTDSINKSHWNTDGIKHKTYISIKKQTLIK